MKKFYIFPCLVQLRGKTKVALMTFAIMFFTMAFAQAQETGHSNRNGRILLAKEQANQHINSNRMQSLEAQSVSLRNTVIGTAMPTFNLGNSRTTSSATGACSKGAIDVSIDQIYGNLNTYTFADDFVVAPHEKFYLEEIEFIFLLDYTVTPNEMFLDFYENANGGGPGAIFPVNLDDVQVNMENLGEYGTTIKDIILITVSFATPKEFRGGMEGASYWGGVRITHNGGPNSAAAVGTSTMSASQTFYVNPGSSWIKSTDAYVGVPPQDLIAGFYGQCEDVPVYIYQNGGWTPGDPSGVATNLDNILVVNGTTSLTADTDVNNLLVKQGATLNINNVLNLHGDLTIKGDLVFVSTATGNGELGEVEATSTILGNATVQRYMQNKRSYRMVSPSVTTTNSIHANWQEGATSNTNNPRPGFGTHITGSITDQQNGFDGTPEGLPSLFTMDLSSAAFVAVPNTNVRKLNVGMPYFMLVRGDRSLDINDEQAASETVLRAKGALHVGYQTQLFDAVSVGVFPMFGNPYQSTVNVNSLLENAVNVNNRHYYVYDPSLGSQGAYVTVDLLTGSNTSSSAANQFLQPGQGAQFATASAGTSAIVFAESDKAPGNFTTTNAMENNLTSENMLTVQLYTTDNFNNAGPVHDSFGIIFGAGNNNGITLDDALKPLNLHENFGRDHNGTYLSLERRAMPQDGDLYSIYSSGYDHNDYTLRMNIDGLTDISLYLNDHFMGTSTLMEGGETLYAFSVDSNDPLSIASDRFSIGTENLLSVNSNDMLAGVQLFPNPLSDNTFYINAPKLNGETVTVTVNDMLGREIYNAQHVFSGATVHIELTNEINNGVYMVTLSSNGEDRSLRIIKR